MSMNVSKLKLLELDTGNDLEKGPWYCPHSLLFGKLQGQSKKAATEFSNIWSPRFPPSVSVQLFVMFAILRNLNNLNALKKTRKHSFLHVFFSYLVFAQLFVSEYFQYFIQEIQELTCVYNK